MVHARHLERYPVLQVDCRDRDFFADPAAPRPDDSLRAAWAGEALAAAWPDGGPFADRLALLDLCNPCALDGDVPGTTRAVLPLGGVIKARFLTLVSRFGGIPAVLGRESHFEQSAAGGHPDQ